MSSQESTAGLLFNEALGDMVSDAVLGGQGIAGTEVDLPEPIVDALDFSERYFQAFHRLPFKSGETYAMYETVPFVPFRYLGFRRATAPLVDLQKSTLRTMLGHRLYAQARVYNAQPPGGKGLLHRDNDVDITVVAGRGDTLVEHAKTKEAWENGEVEEIRLSGQGLWVVLGSSLPYWIGRNLPAPMHQFSETSGTDGRDSIALSYHLLKAKVK